MRGHQHCSLRRCLALLGTVKTNPEQVCADTLYLPTHPGYTMGAAVDGGTYAQSGVYEGTGCPRTPVPGLVFN